MSWWTRRREGLEDDLDEEMRFHLDACTDDLIRSGLPRQEALRRAPGALRQRRGREGRLPAGAQPAARR